MISSRGPLQTARFCAYAGTCSSPTHSCAGCNARAGNSANQGRILACAWECDWKKGRSMAARIHRSPHSRSTGFMHHRDYIHQNPVARKIVNDPYEYRYCSAYPGFKLDTRPSAAQAEIFGSTPIGTSGTRALPGSRDVKNSKRNLKEIYLRRFTFEFAGGPTRMKT